ncbi:MAG: hypothetical protein J7K21_03725 [Desulfurococcales archaeon]|nr:hypothetical protein [Desulfurococcales archaeon]
MVEKKDRFIVVKVPEEVYISLRERGRAEGYTLLSDYVRAIIFKELGLDRTSSRIEKVEQKIMELEQKISGKKLPDLSRINRLIDDKVNAVSEQVTKLATRIAEVVERIDYIEDKIRSLEQKISQPPTHYPPHPGRGEGKRKTGLERLREQGVLFESELKRLRDRDVFFAYLARGGAKIIEAAGERIAVDPGFWEKFKEKLFREITTNNEDQIRILMNKAEYRLFIKLKESGLIYFDSSEHRWKPVSKDLL